MTGAVPGRMRGHDADSREPHSRGGAEATQFTVTRLFGREHPAAPLTWTGQVPTRLDRLLRAADQDLRAILGDGAVGGLG